MIEKDKTQEMFFLLNKSLERRRSKDGRAVLSLPSLTTRSVGSILTLSFISCDRTVRERTEKKSYHQSWHADNSTASDKRQERSSYWQNDAMLRTRKTFLFGYFVFRDGHILINFLCMTRETFPWVFYSVTGTFSLIYCIWQEKRFLGSCVFSDGHILTNLLYTYNERNVSLGLVFSSGHTLTNR